MLKLQLLSLRNSYSRKLVKMSFSQKFSSILTMIEYSGIYTGAIGKRTIEFFKTTVPLQFFYCALLNCFVFILQAEMIYGIFSGKPCLYPPFFMAFCWGVIFWSWLKGFHALLYKTQIERISYHWGISLKPELWPELRKNELDAVNAKLTKVIYISSLTLNIPMTIAAFFKTFWAGTLFIPSGFAPDYNTVQAAFWVLFFQNFGILCFNITWIGLELFISLLMNVILADFKYLRIALEKILNNHEKNTTNSDKTHKSLKKWIKHHSSVLRFVKLFEKTFSIVFCGQFLFITIAMCGLLFSTVSGKIPKENTLYCMINICGNMLLKLNLCRNGDAIAEQSSKLGLVCLSSTRLDLPHDILSILKVVNQVTQREIIISMQGLVPLNSDTFRKMVILQYKFYTFISDTQN